MKQIMTRSNLTMDILAVILGIVGGLAGFAFRKSVEILDSLMFGTEGEGLSVFSLWDSVFYAIGLSWLILIIIPTVGGLIVGPIISKVAPEAKGHGIPNVMESMYIEEGKMRTRVPVAKYLLSVVSIGTGSSAGAEGPIAQVGAGLGSVLGQRLNMRPAEINVLIATGAAAGIASVFNAPLGGALFGIEILLASVAVHTVVPVTIGAVTAVTINHILLNRLTPVFQVPVYTPHAPIEFIFIIILGLSCGFLGILWQKSLYFFEDTFENLKKIPEWSKPAIGAFFVGIFLLLNIEVRDGIIKFQGLSLRGSGYAIIQSALNGYGADKLQSTNLLFMLIGVLLLMCLLKIVVTSLSIGSGASGGIFAPSLYMGATLGTAYGILLSILFPQLPITPGLYGLVGMSAMFAGVARAPLTMIVISTEMSGDYYVFPALMLACSASFLVHQQFVEESIYTQKLASEGVTSQARSVDEVLNYILVKDVMHTEVVAILEDTHVRDFMDIFIAYRHIGYPVVDKRGNLLGIFSLLDFRYATVTNKLDVPILDLATKNVITARPEWTVKKALDIMYKYGIGRLPVTVRNNEGKEQVVGIFTRSDLIKCIETFQGALERERVKAVHSIYERVEKPVIELLPSKYPHLKGKVVIITQSWWEQAKAKEKKE